MDTLIGLLFGFAAGGYVINFLEARKGNKHYKIALVAVFFDILASLIIAFNKTDKITVSLSFFQIFHIGVSIIALGLVFFMIFSGFLKKTKIHKKISEYVITIWMISFVTGFFM